MCTFWESMVTHLRVEVLIYNNSLGNYFLAIPYSLGHQLRLSEAKSLRQDTLPTTYWPAG